MDTGNATYKEVNKEWKATCRECSDSYYCHNAEGLQNALFCFNAKSLRNAVGNAEVGKERFIETKNMVLDYVRESLKRKKDVDLSIFNIACGGKDLQLASLRFTPDQ